MLFESHAHYDDEAFENDREELLSQLNGNGIGYVVNVSSDLASVRSTVEMTRRYPFVYGAVGIHPSDTGNLEEADLAFLKEQCGQPKIVAVGEIGLDYHWDGPKREVQKRWFQTQLRLSQEVKLPVILHSRDAAKDTLEVLKAAGAPEEGGVIHCFSYTKETAADYLDLGFYFGIGGVITFDNAKKLKETVEYLPLDRILLETDSPYLSPAPHRGKRNCSLHLPFIARKIAEIKGLDYEKVVEVTTQNAKNLFRIP